MCLVVKINPRHLQNGKMKICPINYTGIVPQIKLDSDNLFVF